MSDISDVVFSPWTGYLKPAEDKSKHIEFLSIPLGEVFLIDFVNQERKIPVLRRFNPEESRNFIRHIGKYTNELEEEIQSYLPFSLTYQNLVDCNDKVTKIEEAFAKRELLGFGFNAIECPIQISHEGKYFGIKFDSNYKKNKELVGRSIKISRGETPETVNEIVDEYEILHAGDYDNNPLYYVTRLTIEEVK